MGTPAWSAEPETGTKLHVGQNQMEGGERKEGGRRDGQNSKGEERRETRELREMCESCSEGGKRDMYKAGWTK